VTSSQQVGQSEQSEQVTVRFWASARAAAGVAEERTTPGPLDEVLIRLADAHGERLGRILGYCAFLLDGAAVRDRSRTLPPGSVLEVLPPFAGG
jgi:molybdopterin converting factor small subunit